MSFKETIKIDIYKYIANSSTELFIDDANVTIDQLRMLLKDSNKIIRYSDDNTIVTKENMFEHFANMAPERYIDCYGVDSSGNVDKMGLVGFSKISTNQFYHNTNLKEIDMTRSTISTIEDDAFYQCSGLTNINLPNTLTSIGKEAFYECSSLAITSLPDSVTTFGEFVFSGCTKLALTALPDGLTSISGYAFDNCSQMPLEHLPENVTYIGFASFRDGHAIKITRFPASLKAIDHWGFSRCYELKSLVFEGTPDSISQVAFDSCDGITDIKVPWSSGAIDNAPWGATNATITYDYVPNT